MSAFFDAIIRGSIRNRPLVLAGVAVLLVLTALFVPRARLDALPSFTPPMVSVQTEAPGFASAAVEEQVTTPLERALAGLPGLTHLRSTSSAGLSVVRMTFEQGTHIFRARQLVSERLSLVRGRLGAGASPPSLAPIASPVGALLKLTYTLDTADPERFAELSRFVMWQVGPRLSALSGVAHVTVHGADEPRVEVHPRSARMLARGVSLDDLRQALSSAQGVSSLGYASVGEQSLPVRADGRWSVANLNAIAGLSLGTRDGLPLRLDQVADVRWGTAPPVGRALYDGERAVYLQVNKLPWADTLGLTERVEAALTALDAEVPAGARRHAPTFRQADFIRTSLHSVARAMGIGAFFVITILLAFLRSPRAAMVSLTALPLSLTAALLVLVLSGVTINGMVLGGLAIAVGEVVDDAIVDVENIWRRLRENAGLASPRPTIDVVHDASVEVRSAVVYASLIVVVVLIPVLLVGGVAGRIFSPLAQAYMLAVGTSLVVALTVTPALSAWLLRDGRVLEREEGRVVRLLRERYDHLLRTTQRNPQRVLWISAIIAAAALATLPFLGGSFLPEFREGVLIAEVQAWPGTSIEETSRIASRLSQGLRSRGAVGHVAARIGRAALDEDSAPTNRVEMDLVLAPDAGDPDEVAGLLMAQMAQMPGIRFAVDGFLGERVNELLSGERAPIAVKFMGEDLAQLQRVGASLIAELHDVPELTGVRSTNLVNAPTRDIHLLPAQMDMAGMRRADVLDGVAASERGLVVTDVRAPNGFVVPLVLCTRGADALEDAPISTPLWGIVPLTTLARVERGEEPAVINHEEGRRVVTITGQAPTAALVAVTNDVAAKVRALHRPAGIEVRIEGQAAERGKASGRLLWTALLVLGAVLVFLWVAFHSLTDACVVVAGLPLGLVGGVAAAWLMPDGLSMSGLIGFVTLAGIISRNGIMLVSHKNRLVAGAPESEVEDRILQAARERLVPIVMTASAALLGLLPLAASLDAAGSELEAPMALIVCGGLVSSTALNLWAVPAFYLWRADREKRPSAAS